MRPYPAELEADLVLRDGSRVRVRPMRPDDIEHEKRFFEGLSERSRFLRFMHAINELSPGMLERFTRSDYERDLALVALHAEEFVAVGRYAPGERKDKAEFALVVADAWQRRGLGRALLAMLRDEARKAGYRALYGTVLDDNHEMMNLVRAMGFGPAGREGAGVVMESPLI
jgi:acetyltransferase